MHQTLHRTLAVRGESRGLPRAWFTEHCADRHSSFGPSRGEKSKDTSPGNYCYLQGKPTPRKKNAFASHPRGSALRLSAHAPRAVDLEVALLAERRARGRDGQRMRSPQLARCSRDQIRLRMAAALARGRGSGCEVFMKCLSAADGSPASLAQLPAG